MFRGLYSDPQLPCITTWWFQWDPQLLDLLLDATTSTKRFHHRWFTMKVLLQRSHYEVLPLCSHYERSHHKGLIMEVTHKKLAHQMSHHRVNTTKVTPPMTHHRSNKRRITSQRSLIRSYMHHKELIIHPNTDACSTRCASRSRLKTQHDTRVHHKP